MGSRLFFFFTINQSKKKFSILVIIIKIFDFINPYLHLWNMIKIEEEEANKAVWINE